MQTTSLDSLSLRSLLQCGQGGKLWWCTGYQVWMVGRKTQLQAKVFKAFLFLLFANIKVVAILKAHPPFCGEGWWIIRQTIRCLDGSFRDAGERGKELLAFIILYCFFSSFKISCCSCHDERLLFGFHTQGRLQKYSLLYPIYRVSQSNCQNLILR